jgi:hypothetical protein
LVPDLRGERSLRFDIIVGWQQALTSVEEMPSRVPTRSYVG